MTEKTSDAKPEPTQLPTLDEAAKQNKPTVRTNVRAGTEINTHQTGRTFQDRSY